MCKKLIIFVYLLWLLMNNQKEYKIVACYSIVDLEKEVLILLNDGWALMGGIATRTGDHGEGVYYQAVCRGMMTGFYI